MVAGACGWGDAMATVRFQGGELYYEAHGRGPALIFAHGIGGNALSWWQQVPAFGDRYTCIVFDAPGFGRSDDPSGEWTQVDALAALIDHLELADVRLVAQSMGGTAALGYAIARPERVRALVMADTFGRVQLPELAGWMESLRAAGEPLAARGIHPACGERMAVEQPALHFLYQQVSGLNALGYSPAKPPGGFTRAPAATPAQLAALGVPALFLLGEEDPLISLPMVEAVATLIPGARIESVPAAGHSVYFERPEVFNRLVGDFLRSVEG